MKMTRDDSGERDGWWLDNTFFHAPKVGQIWERGGRYYLISRVSESGRTVKMECCTRDGARREPLGLGDVRTSTLFQQFAQR